MNGDGTPEVVAGCEDGAVWLLSGCGEKLGRIPGEGRVTALWCGELVQGDSAAVVVGSSEGTLKAWEVSG